MASGWWASYGLLFDPVMNAPVPRGDNETLVLTPAVAEIKAYLDSPSRIGRIFLVSGEYGSGKTSALNAIDTLVDEIELDYEVFHEDISKFRSKEKLQGLFKTVSGKAEGALKRGKRPVFAFDQMHQMKPGLMEDFFTKEQTSFEALKSTGVTLVFAGDSRFRSLVTTAGPLGAIFDREFPLPPFEEEMATEMIHRLMKKASGDDVLFPFTDEAMSEVVRQANGVPRHIVELCGVVMRHAASQTHPIRIDVNEVKSATANLTDEALNFIRSQLRSPSVSNCLAKLGKVHAAARGHEKIHEAGRLLDKALEFPSKFLEELAEDIQSLSLRPDVVIEVLADLGLLETKEIRRKGKYGSITEVLHRLSKSAVASLAEIREETGLTPSQYLHRVSQDAAPIKLRTGTDLLRVDLDDLRGATRSQRAKTFVGRAIKGVALTDSPDASEEDFLSAFENFLRAISLSVLNQVRTDWLQLVKELNGLLKIPEDEQQHVVAGCERLIELGTIYRERAVDWTDDQRKDAREALRNVIHSICTAASQVQKSGRNPVEEKNLQETLAENHKEMQKLLGELGSGRSPNKHSPQPSVVEKTLGEAKVRPRDRDLLFRLLSALDEITHMRAIEHEQHWHSGPFHEAVLGFASGNQDSMENGLRVANQLVSHLAEQGPSIVAGKPIKEGLGKTVDSLIQSPWARTEFQKLKKTRGSATEPEETAKIFRELLEAFRTDREDDWEASLLAWYFLRNLGAHMRHSLVRPEIRHDLVRSFALACLQFCLASFSHDTFTGPTLGIVSRDGYAGLCTVAVNGMDRIALVSGSAQAGKLVRVSMPSHKGVDVPCRLDAFCDWADLKRAPSKELTGLPSILRDAVIYLRKEERQDPKVRSLLDIYALRLNSNGNACVFYGTKRTPCLVRAPGKKEAPAEIVEGAMGRADIIGLPYPRGGDKGVNVLPVLVGWPKDDLEVIVGAIKSPKPGDTTDSLKDRDEFEKPWKFNP